LVDCFKTIRDVSLRRVLIPSSLRDQDRATGQGLTGRYGGSVPTASRTAGRPLLFPLAQALFLSWPRLFRLNPGLKSGGRKTSMSPAKPRALLEIAYEEAAQAYLRSLPPEHFMEATAQATQRKITLESLDVLRVHRPDVQVFNELLVQYPLPGQRK